MNTGFVRMAASGEERTRMDFSQSFKQVRDSVLHILAMKDSREIVSSCSGVLVLDGSVAITCAHCVFDGIRIFARLPRKDTLIEGKLHKTDAGKDIAIIRFPNQIGLAVKMKNSDTVEIGQEAFIAGFPLNITSITTLLAHIAGFEQHEGFDLIRIDASINHGLSGGPLFNICGELIGIVNAKHGSLSGFLKRVETAQPGARISIGGIDPVEAIQQLIREMKINLNLGIGYAIPINVVGSVDNDIKTTIMS